MKSIKGTKTEKNLLASFAGESQARNRYTYFASVAKKEGYEQMSWIFTDTAENEKEHAKRFFKFLEGGTLEITASYPAGKINTTLENLIAAAAVQNDFLGRVGDDPLDIPLDHALSEMNRVFNVAGQPFVVLPDVDEKEPLVLLDLCGHLIHGEFLHAPFGVAYDLEELRCVLHASSVRKEKGSCERES